MAHALESVHLEQFEFETPEHAAESLRHAIVTCSAADVFKASLNKVRSSDEHRPISC